MQFDPMHNRTNMTVVVVIGDSQAGTSDFEVIMFNIGTTVELTQFWLHVDGYNDLYRCSTVNKEHKQFSYHTQLALTAHRNETS